MRDAAAEAGPVLLDEQARELYLAILRQGGRLRADEVEAGSRPSLHRLMALGLVRAQPIDAAYSAVSPRSAGESLASALRADANRRFRAARDAQGLFEELAQAFDATTRSYAGRRATVEHISGMAEIRHRVSQLAAETSREIWSAQPGGARPAGLLAEGLTLGMAFAEQGVTVSTLYQPGAKSDPPTADYAATLTAVGARFRVLDEPFQRLFIFDRAVAIMPAAEDNSAAAFVEDPATVALLVDLFERDWQRAERVRWSAPVEAAGADTVQARVARLLATGLTQHAVAGRLGLSERTVAAHLARLRQEHEAETSFQLGWLMRGRQN